MKETGAGMKETGAGIERNMQGYNRKAWVNEKVQGSDRKSVV